MVSDTILASPGPSTRSLYFCWWLARCFLTDCLFTQPVWSFSLSINSYTQHSPSAASQHWNNQVKLLRPTEHSYSYSYSYSRNLSSIASVLTRSQWRFIPRLWGWLGSWAVGVGSRFHTRSLSQNKSWNRNAMKSNIKSMRPQCNAMLFPHLSWIFILHWINCYFLDFWGFHYQNFPKSPCTIYQNWLKSFLSCSEGLYSRIGREAGLPPLITSLHF